MTRVRAVIVALTASLAVPALAAGAPPPRGERNEPAYRYGAPYLSPDTAAPTLTVEPPGGAPGSLARITGAQFHEHVAAYFGRRRMRILERGRDYLVVEIPRAASRPHFIYVVDSTGQARTAQRFFVGRAPRYAPTPQPRRYGSPPPPPPAPPAQPPYRQGRPFERGPRITWFLPRSAKPHDRVALRVDNADRNTRVYLDGHQVPIVARPSPGELVVEIPATVPPGNYWFYVGDHGPRTRSLKTFTVDHTAVIQGAPETAIAGGAIEIQGRYFDRDTRVFFGTRELEVISRLPRTLVVRLPPDLHGSDYLIVTDRGIASRSERPLRVEGQGWWP